MRGPKSHTRELAPSSAVRRCVFELFTPAETSADDPTVTLPEPPRWGWRASRRVRARDSNVTDKCT